MKRAAKEVPGIRLLFPILFGLAGVGVLLWLSFWQLQRLEWKRAILAEIDNRVASAPVPLPENPTEAADEYLAVFATGRFGGGEELHVLSSGTGAGTGYRVITVFETETGRRIMLDLGLLPLIDKSQPAPQIEAEVIGNLIWPDDKTSATPEPDLAGNIWFGREVPAMAAALDTEELMVVLRNASALDERVIPVPVDTGGIKNNHREYAITWFLLALVWAAMSIAFIVLQLKKAKT